MPERRRADVLRSSLRLWGRPERRSETSFALARFLCASRIGRPSPKFTVSSLGRFDPRTQSWRYRGLSILIGWLSLRLTPWLMRSKTPNPYVRCQVWRASVVDGLLDH